MCNRGLDTKGHLRHCHFELFLAGYFGKKEVIYHVNIIIDIHL